MQDGPRAPIARDVLERFRRRSRSHPLVVRTRFERSGETVRSLRLELDSDRYPSPVVSATLTVTWYENEEYSFHYRERRPEGCPELWQCRWDRHPNPHAAYAHFHEPPTADDSSVVDDPVDSTHPSEMLTRTFANVEDRIADLWA